MANVTIPAVNLTSKVTDIQPQGDGSVVVVFQLLDGAGAIKATKRLHARNDGSGVWDLDLATLVAASTPAAILNGTNTLVTAIETALTSAAAAGKITI